MQVEVEKKMEHSQFQEVDLNSRIYREWAQQSIKHEGKRRDSTYPQDYDIRFKEFYRSFLKDDIRSLLVSSQKIKEYSYDIRITHERIDYKRKEQQNKQRYIYQFNARTLTVNGQQKGEEDIEQFFDMMRQVSQDVKEETSKLLMELK
ncbi:hypothetical protein DID78_04035 [Candidatus Marinamargulisbacteria bacterium SCGC AG-343-D04]|nr:hypothetical protein DID78_04035 [Candidatus Marinamargulisbacteria bacterium SCGC AG-343-D04]